MSGSEKLSREKLTAYALGELDSGEARGVEDALKTDAEAASALEEIRATALLAREVLSSLPQDLPGLSDGQREEVRRNTRRGAAGVLSTTGEKGAVKGTMKIECGKCGAKYSIADDKVKGKTIKIRCKKCQESIIVHGDAPAPAPQQGVAKTVPDDLFGGGDDLFSKDEGGGGPGDVFSSTSGGDFKGGIFAEGSSKPSGQVSPFDEPLGDELDINVEVSRPSMKGQRGEDSVLFSLNNLQALADGKEESKQTKIDPSGMGVVGESSGLVDIRFLADSMKDVDESEKDVDELLAISPMGLGSGLGAPVLSASERRGGMSTGMKIGIAVGGFMGVAAVVLAVILLTRPEPAPQNDKLQDQIAQLSKALEEMKKSGASQGEIEKAQQELEEKQAVAEEAEKAAEAEGKGDAKKVASASKKSSSKSKSSGGSKSSSSKGDKVAAASSSSSGSSSKPKSSKGSSELDDLLGGATSGPKKKSKSSSKSSSSSSGGGSVPDKLSRSQVQSGMNAVAKSVKRCGHGKSGTITVKATIAPTGRVTSANTTGSFAGTPEGACAAGAVRRARFPKSNNKLTVTYPFKL